MSQSKAADQKSTETAQSQEQADSVESRPALEIQPARRNLPTYYNRRPVDPSPVQVSQIVSMAGRRPIMANTNSGQQPLDFTQAPSMFNRPIAPNVTEDEASLMGYID